MEWIALVFMLAGALCIYGVPGFVIARRRGLRYPWMAFLPLLGFWIVLCEAMGKSGWLALLVFIPYAGAIGLLVWTAVEIPARHGRSRWWTLPLIVPLVNVVGYWWYAFTLSRDEGASPLHPGQLSLS